MSEVLARREHALSPEETEQVLRDQLGDGLLQRVEEYGTFTQWVSIDAWVDAVQMCRDEPRLAFDLFDCLFGVDAREDGFDVVVVLYSTSTGNRIALRTRCDGGRDAPTCPSIHELYRGANFMERETWDMFGIEFTGHPGLAPRLLTTEEFEGWPLRKDFFLASRVAKPWPGVKEPVELDEDGNPIERVTGPGDAPGPSELDKVMAEHAKRATPPTEPSRPERRSTARLVEESRPGEPGDDDPADTAARRAEAARRAAALARRIKAEERIEDADDPLGGDR